LLKLFRDVFNPYDVVITEKNKGYRWLVFIIRILVLAFIVLTISRYLNI